MLGDRKQSRGRVILAVTVMAQAIDVVQGMLEAYRGGTDEALAYFHPEVAYDTTVRPDGRVWHGREGVRRAMFEWTSTWDEFEMQIERCIPAPDGRVVALWRERGRAKGSGLTVAEHGVSVFTVQDGMIVSVVVHLDRRAALQDAGLHSA
jgi:ketosteroid isomerase-like protein